MNRKLVVLLSIGLLLLVVIIQLSLSPKNAERKNDTNSPEVTTPNTSINESVNEESPFLSQDRKKILSNNKVLLEINDKRFFEWFKTESQLCDQSNRGNTSDREDFCTNEKTFENLTRFSSIQVSPNKRSIGFNIETDTLSPDIVSGVFSLPNNQINFLTNFYLGNEFLSFSPDSSYFIYQGSCFEAHCGLFVRDANTLDIVASINNPESADMREYNASFVRWITDNYIEYKLGDELKQMSF